MATQKRVPLFEDELEEVEDKKPETRKYDASRDTFLPNLAAAPTDFAATFPMLAGLIGAGGEAIYENITEDKDTPFTEHFEKALSTGADKSLMEAGRSTRLFGRDLLGLPEFSRSRSGQLGEIAGMVGIPVPGSALVRMAGNLGGRAAALATPLVRIEGGARGLVPKALGGSGHLSGNIGRYGTQLGIAGGIDQTVRSIADEPTLIDPDKIPKSDRVPMFEDEVTQTQDVAQQSRVPMFTDEKVNVTPTGQLTTDAQMEEEQNRTNAAYSLLAAGTLILTSAALAYRGRKSALAKYSESSRHPAGVSESPVPPKIGKKGQLLDRDDHIKDIIRASKDDAGNPIFNDDQIDEIVSQFSNDATGQATRALISRDMGLDSGYKMRHSFQEWMKNVDSLGEEGKNKLFSGMLAAKEKVTRARSTLAKEVEDTELLLAGDDSIDLRKMIDEGSYDQVIDTLKILQKKDVPDIHVTPGFYKNAHKAAKAAGKQERPLTSKELDEMENAMRSDSRLKDLARQYDEMTEDQLEFLVQKRIITADQKQIWRQIWQNNSVGTYVPGIAASIKGTDDGIIERLLTQLGINTPVSTELLGISSLRSAIAATGEGIKTPINPGEAFAFTMHSLYDHANRSNAQQNVLANILGVQRTGDNVGRLKSVDKHGKSTLKNKFGIEYIGMHDPTNKGRTIKELVKEFNPKSRSLAKKFNTEVSVNNMELANHNIIKTQELGKEFLYYVPNKALYDALYGGPRQLSMFNKIGRAFKNIFQMTTTRLPMFLPISWAYATQASMGASLLRKQGYTPWTAFKGTYKLLAASLAEETSTHIMRSLGSNSGVFSMLPREMAEGLQKRLANAAENSLMHGIKSRTGHLSTAMSTSDIQPTVIDVMKDVYPIDTPLTTLRQGWRYYSTIVRAVGEGPAYAAMTMKQGGRALEDLKGKDYRAIRKYGADITGDVRRMGGSRFAEGVNSWVPFSGPMIQEWNSLGMALNQAAKKGNYHIIAGVASIGVIPAMMEAIQTSLMGEEYQDYFWNKLSTTQRNNYVHIFIPGKPPEEALVIPVAPGLTILRAFGIEAVDAITGLSKIMPHKGEFGNGSHMLAALTRFFDIPVPTPIKAGFAAMGYNLQLGPKFDEDGMSLASTRPLGAGERISGMKGRSRFVDPVVDKEIEGVLQALGGGAVSLLINMFQGFRTGSSSNAHDHKGTPISNALEGLTEGLREGISKQAKYVPVTGGTLRPTPFDEISDQVMSMQKGVDVINNLWQTALGGEGDIKSLDDPMKFAGAPVPVTTDPLIMVAMQTMEGYQMDFAYHKKKISEARGQMDSLRSSATYRGDDGRQYKIKDFNHRNELMDQWAMNAKKHYLLYRYRLEDYEAEVNEAFYNKYGRNAEFDLTDVEPRPEVGFGGPFSRILSPPR